MAGVVNTMNDRMSKRMRTYVAIAVLATLTTLLAPGSAGAQGESALAVGSKTTTSTFPTVSEAAELVDIGTSAATVAQSALNQCLDLWWEAAIELPTRGAQRQRR